METRCSYRYPMRNEDFLSPTIPAPTSNVICSPGRITLSDPEASTPQLSLLGVTALSISNFNDQIDPGFAMRSTQPFFNR